MKKNKKIICMLFAFLLIVGLVSGIPAETQAATQFKVTEKQMKKAVNGYSVQVTVNEKKQRFMVKSSEITKFTVKSKKYSSDKKSLTIKAIAYIDRKVAMVKSSVTIKYKLKGSKWKVSSVQFGDGIISSVRLKGTWTGTYVAGQGQTKAKFEIKEVSKDGYASGTFSFFATPTNPRVPSGSYSVTGGYDKKTGKVTFVGDEWIDQPLGYSMVDFYGYLDLKNKKIRSDNYLLSISKKK